MAPNTLEHTMAAPSTDRTSLWHGTERAATPPPLDGSTRREVVVVGGGITGLTTAALLAEAGRDVVVLEARRVAAGTTGGTTGKLTSQHGMIYADLVDRHGADVARAYGIANEAAIAQVGDLCRRYGISADLAPEDSHLYVDVGDDIDPVLHEAEVPTQLGLPAEWVESTALPFPVAGALRFTGQARLHAVRYCNGLVDVLQSLGVPVHGGTRVTSVQEQGETVQVTTDHGVVTADHAVLATLAPITDRGFEFARMRATRSYGVAARVEGPVPDGMYMSVGQPTRSISQHRDGDDQYVVVVGQSHETGHASGVGNDDALADFARRHFDVRDIPFRWSAQDFVPDDRLPFVGTTGFADRIHVATGFQKWGLTNAMVAARLLVDVIAGDANVLADMLSPTRTSVTASARSFVGHNLDVAKRFVGDRVAPQAGHVDDIPPGGGATVRVDGRMMAISRDEDGHTTALSATCSHLGCIVQWNVPERSWDCPCHGSRFSPTGEVISGPATQPLRERGAPGEVR